MLDQLEAIIFKWATKQYRDGVQWNPVSLKFSDKDGIYILRYSISGGLKFGMSFRAWSRVKEQNTEENPVQYGAKLFDATQAKAMVPQHIVDEIVALSLPGLWFHGDHEGHLCDLIRLQLVELFLACYYTCVTQTVGERLVQLPSTHVRSITQETLPALPDGAREFLADMGDGDAWCIHTWPTLRSRLQEMAYGSEMDRDNQLLLQRVLPPLPPMGGYVTANRFMELFGAKFGWCEDCLDYSPRETTVNQCIAQLRENLQTEVDPNDKDQCLAIRQVLAAIQGENYKSYVRPSTPELARAARSLVERYLSELPVHKVIVIERCSVGALRKEHSRFWENTVDMQTEILLLPKEYGLSLIRATTGHRIIITPSFFLMFAEETIAVVRFRIVKAYLRLLQLLEKCGHVTTAHADNIRRNLRSFLMGMEFGQSETLFANAGYHLAKNDPDEDDCYDDSWDDSYDEEDESEEEEGEEEEDEGPVASYRMPRNLAMPAGYFKGPKKRVLGVSRALRIGYCETLFIRVSMTKTEFARLLVAHRILKKGQTDAPFELSFQCPGHDPVQGCQHLDNNKCNTHVYLMGKSFGQDHPWYGGFLCTNCRVKVIRDHNIETQGYETFRETERKANRGFEAQKHLGAFQGDPDALQWKAKRSKYLSNRYEILKAQGHIVTSTGSDIKKKGKYTYPPAVAKIMAQAAQMWIDKRQEPFVMWPSMVALLLNVAQVEAPNYANTTHKHWKKCFKVNDKGQLTGYYKHGFKDAVKHLLEEPTPVVLNGKTTYIKAWKVKNYSSTAEEPREISGKRDADEILRDKIMTKLYASTEDDDGNDDSHRQTTNKIPRVSIGSDENGSPNRKKAKK